MIEFNGDTAIVNAYDVAFTYETTESPREFDKYRSSDRELDWTDDDYHIGDYRIYPYGSDNNLPKSIKDVVQTNYIAPGILKKKSQLLWGKGPKLYREEFDKSSNLVRKYINDKDIEDWMQSWDAESYISKCNVDYSHMEGCFSKFFQSKGGRIGAPSIAKLEHVSMNNARLASLKDSIDFTPTHGIVTDWGFNKIQDLTKFKAYPLFDYNNPFKSKHALMYSNMYSFCSDYYTVPDLYGSMEWLKRGTAIPLILKALTKNGINPKYHVTSPAHFWTEKRKELKDWCADNNKKYEEKMLQEYKTDFLRQISKVLSDAENTGKFWHSIKYLEVDNTKVLEHGWEIKPIDQNIKDFVQAQITISEHANRQAAAGVGMHTALTGSGESGRADSGSEQLYALKNYLITGIDIPEMIVLKAINYAIKANFPNKNLKLGFYHISPQREEDTSSNDRIKNQV